MAKPDPLALQRSETLDALPATLTMLRRLVVAAFEPGDPESDELEARCWKPAWWAPTVCACVEQLRAREAFGARMTSSKSTDAIEFDAAAAAPQKALLELHRVAQTEEARVALVRHVRGRLPRHRLARRPRPAGKQKAGRPAESAPQRLRGRGRLRVVRGSDAA